MAWVIKQRKTITFHSYLRCKNKIYIPFRWLETIRYHFNSITNRISLVWKIRHRKCGTF